MALAAEIKITVRLGEDHEAGVTGVVGFVAEARKQLHEMFGADVVEAQVSFRNVRGTKEGEA